MIAGPAKSALPVNPDEDAEASPDGGHDLAVDRHGGRGHALHHSLHLEGELAKLSFPSLSYIIKRI